jgi:dihydrofolate synthase/folylpolyglutamate synthase
LRAAALGALGAAPTAVVFGALADKPWEAMARVLMPAFPRRIFTEPPGRSPADPEALRALFDGEVVRDPVRALGRALEIAAPGEAVLVTGSIYLVGRVRAALLGLVADPAMGL